jgi:hypothetical protein
MMSCHSCLQARRQPGKHCLSSLLLRYGSSRSFRKRMLSRFGEPFPDHRLAISRGLRHRRSPVITNSNATERLSAAQIPAPTQSPRRDTSVPGSGKSGRCQLRPNSIVLIPRLGSRVRIRTDLIPLAIASRRTSPTNRGRSDVSVRVPMSISSLAIPSSCRLEACTKQRTSPTVLYPRSIKTISLPDGTTLDYSYESTTGSQTGYQRYVRLKTFSRSTPSAGIVDSETYLYENPDGPSFLTGVIDHAGVRFATWEYDVQGRVTSAQQAGGANGVTVAYTSDSTYVYRTVTNALGRQTIYRFASSQGSEPYLNKVTGTASPNCAGTIASITYDTNKRISTKVDEGKYDEGIPTRSVTSPASPRAMPPAGRRRSSIRTASPRRRPTMPWGD